MNSTVSKRAAADDDSHGSLEDNTGDAHILKKHFELVMCPSASTSDNAPPTNLQDLESEALGLPAQAAAHPASNPSPDAFFQQSSEPACTESPTCGAENEELLPQYSNNASNSTWLQLTCENCNQSSCYACASRFLICLFNRDAFPVDAGLFV
ncbi:hypothetical protein BDR06DRAFT_977574 [Suillus hirtellus]|nr:hypothetical protein BDR06DRAFT_977574 [Suillus hirtellus]